jgi:predicted alpha/beta hydrolase family esterase
MNAPKLFISYSWSNPEHEQWVLDLATQLRESEVDVILDKWDLKEG